MKAVRFERSGAGKAKGCLVYVVAAPAVALMLWIFTAGAINHVFVKWFHTTQHTATWASFVSLPILLIATIKWSWKDYFRAGNAYVTFAEDRIDVEAYGVRRSFPFSSINDVQLKPYYNDLKVVLRPSKGPAFTLPGDLVPFKEIRDVMEATLIPHLEKELDAQVVAGGTVRMTESRALAALRFPWAVLNIVFGIPMVASLVHAHWGVELLMATPRSFRRGWRGLGGGIEFRSAGIAAGSSVVRRTIAWEDLSVHKFDEDGLVLRTRRGDTLSVSPYADHYWPGSRWIVSRITKPPA